eukprot:CAMPEP_0176039300 /NCGR_PEP_ID=MMETSP0120_2-20121206/19481_1 /TAXON_ID=160619 /ORGANISM="Kryptoperidinium foliaceum, Strain CCMP 1326" /LENGTH=589 /DNA_ID=CAMNT_0017372695 /DNA_START=100 /DNA_END=1869 /DNA_ORIENTATION=-
MKKNDRASADVDSSAAEDDDQQLRGLQPRRAAMSADLKEPPIGMDDSNLEGRGTLKEDKTPKLKKHPGAPKRFRTAFIIFSQHRHGELRAKMQEEGAEIDTINVARMVSDQWREMTAEEKEKWEEMAKEDKARYLKQKEEYAGPWKVPADMKKPKDPTAPKKPTPAYFSFSNERRQAVKKANPTASNGEISKMLSKMWKEADEETRAKYVEKEKKEREQYNKAVEKWKKERKESGRENWWEFEQQMSPDMGNERKRAKLDMLADAAPQHEAMGRRDPFAANMAAFAQSQNPLAQSPQEQQMLAALSSGQPDALQTLTNLFPQFSGQQNNGQASSSSSSNIFAPPQPDSQGHPHTPNPQMLSMLQQLLGQQQQAQQQQQQPSPSMMGQQQYGGGGGGGFSLSGLLGQPSNAYSGGGTSTNQTSNLLASLLGGSHDAQQQQQSQGNSSFNALNEMLLSALLRGGGQQQDTQQQQNPISLLQQVLPSNVLQQFQSHSQSQAPESQQANHNSALAALLGQQMSNSAQQDQQYQAPQASSTDQLTQSLLQNLLQQGGGGNRIQEQQQQQQTPANMAALQEVLSRFVRGNSDDQR